MSGFFTAEETESENGFSLRKPINHRDREQTRNEANISIVNWTVKNYSVQIFFPAQLSWANISQK